MSRTQLGIQPSWAKMLNQELGCIGKGDLPGKIRVCFLHDSQPSTHRLHVSFIWLIIIQRLLKNDSLLILSFSKWTILPWWSERSVQEEVTKRTAKTWTGSRTSSYTKQLPPTGKQEIIRMRSLYFESRTHHIGKSHQFEESFACWFQSIVGKTGQNQFQQTDVMQRRAVLIQTWMPIVNNHQKRAGNRPDLRTVQSPWCRT